MEWKEKRRGMKKGKMGKRDKRTEKKTFKI